MNTTNLLLSLIFSCIGFGYFIYGKKQKNITVGCVGVMLMIYPYFVSDTLALLLVGVVLIALPKVIKI